MASTPLEATYRNESRFKRKHHKGTKMESIKCPKCSHPIDVTNVLSNQVRESLQKDFDSKLTVANQEKQTAMDKLQKDIAEFERKKSDQNKIFNDRLSEKSLEQERAIRAKILQENGAQISSLERELNEKSTQLQEYNKTRAALERSEREKGELRSTIELEMEQKATTALNMERDKIRREEAERNDFKVRELQKKLEDQARLTEEMRLRGEQGLTQLQGEVQELAIEEFLRSNFALDTISEVKKGARGADCVLTVNTRTHTSVGAVYIESKRTKEFSPAWIEKFRGDMISQNATFGVLVSDAMPKGWDRMGQLNGIWVATFAEFQGLIFVLREAAVMLHTASSANENREEKMSMLYSFLISPEFKSQVSAIVESFTEMQKDLESEKRSMERIWSGRQKQIQRAITSCAQMYGSIKGIAGSAIESVSILELPQ